MHVEFGKVIKALADASGEELSARQLLQAFEEEYLQGEEVYQLEHFRVEETTQGGENVSCIARLRIEGVPREIRAEGNGPIDSFAQSLNLADIASFKILSYTEH